MMRRLIPTQVMAQWYDRTIGVHNTGIWASTILLGILGIAIWQLRRQQKRMRESESRLRDFAQLASDWLWEQDAELRFTWGSETTTVHEQTDTGFIGRTRWELAAPGGDEEVRRWASHKADLDARQEFRDFRYQRVGSNGRVRYLSASGKPLFDKKGVFAGYRGTGNDITAKVEAEGELRRAKDVAEAASRSKSEFLAMMSHELRTPLHAVIGFSRLIGEQPYGALDPRYLQCATDIHLSGTHLLDLINELLDLSMLDSGRYEIHEERLALRTVVDVCIRMLAPAARDKNVRVECGMNLPNVFLSADRKALRQVMLNLLSNGIKFSQPGGVVSVGAEVEANGNLTLSITDTGIGIEPSKLQDVLKPFYQADANANRQHGGVGLGLAICHRLVTLHGGSIAIESQPGVCTAARVTFPKS